MGYWTYPGVDLEWPNEDRVLDALEVVSLYLDRNTIVSKVKVACGAPGPMNLRMSWDFLPMEF